MFALRAWRVRYFRLGNSIGSAYAPSYRRRVDKILFYRAAQENDYRVKGHEK
jgi:hypothetical protein